MSSVGNGVEVGSLVGVKVGVPSALPVVLGETVSAGVSTAGLGVPSFTRIGKNTRVDAVGGRRQSFAPKTAIARSKSATAPEVIIARRFFA
jgi:hypothetical protein